MSVDAAAFAQSAEYSGGWKRIEALESESANGAAEAEAEAALDAEYARLAKLCRLWGHMREAEDVLARLLALRQRHVHRLEAANAGDGGNAGDGDGGGAYWDALLRLAAVFHTLGSVIRLQVVKAEIYDHRTTDARSKRDLFTSEDRDFVLYNEDGLQSNLKAALDSRVAQAEDNLVRALALRRDVLRARGDALGIEDAAKGFTLDARANAVKALVAQSLSALAVLQRSYGLATAGDTHLQALNLYASEPLVARGSAARGPAARGPAARGPVARGPAAVALEALEEPETEGDPFERGAVGPDVWSFDADADEWVRRRRSSDEKRSLHRSQNPTLQLPLALQLARQRPGLGVGQGQGQGQGQGRGQGRERGQGQREQLEDDESATALPPPSQGRGVARSLACAFGRRLPKREQRRAREEAAALAQLAVEANNPMAAGCGDSDGAALGLGPGPGYSGVFRLVLETQVYEDWYKRDRTAPPDHAVAEEVELDPNRFREASLGSKRRISVAAASGASASATGSGSSRSGSSRSRSARVAAGASASSAGASSAGASSSAHAVTLATKTPFLAKTHARVCYVAALGAWVLRDESKASQGVLVNGLRVKMAVLRAGDVVVFGGSGGSGGSGSAPGEVSLPALRGRYSSPLVFRCERVAHMLPDSDPAGGGAGVGGRELAGAVFLEDEADLEYFHFYALVMCEHLRASTAGPFAFNKAAAVGCSKREAARLYLLARERGVPVHLWVAWIHAQVKQQITSDFVRYHRRKELNYFGL